MHAQMAVEHYVAQHPAVKNYCIAYSGGVDSHVLLALMCELRNSNDTFNVRAIHVDHSLQVQSAQWAEHAGKVCRALQVPLTVRRVQVANEGDGIEASARIVRYAEFSSTLRPDEHLLLAQHAEDQAETFLLQALRGSGPDGLSAIPRKRHFAQGYMGRPLLDCSQDSLLAEAKSRQLEWIEDPSNQDARYDRNFLRLTVMPMLKSRWPAAARTLGRSAWRSAAASQILNSVAKEDLQRVQMDGCAYLSVSELKKLPRERAFSALRLWVRQRGLRMPRLQDLIQVMSDLVQARHDSNGIVNVREYEFRRHKDCLCLLLPHAEIAPFRHLWIAPFDDMLVPETGFVITRQLCERQGIRIPDKGEITVKSRAGGELIKLGEPAYHKAVKKILQEASIPPWQRDSIPLLYIDGHLAAIWNIAVAVDFQRSKAELPASSNNSTASIPTIDVRTDKNGETA